MNGGAGARAPALSLPRPPAWTDARVAEAKARATRDPIDDVYARARVVSYRPVGVGGAHDRCRDGRDRPGTRLRGTLRGRETARTRLARRTAPNGRRAVCRHRTVPAPAPARIPSGPTAHRADGHDRSRRLRFCDTKQTDYYDDVGLDGADEPQLFVTDFGIVPWSEPPHPLGAPERWASSIHGGPA